MMKFVNMNVTQETKKSTNDDFICDFCSKTFKREATMYKHMCEPKRRINDKDKVENRIAFQCWDRFYQKNTNSRKSRTYLDFVKNPYYIAFMKFGTYCVEINAINIHRFMDWLLDNSVPIDKWCKDQIYTKYLIEHLRDEDPLDGVARSIETMIKMSETSDILSQDMLRYGNKNRICHHITAGRITPWVLYQSKSGLEFIESLDSQQQALIFDYINPELWAVKFARNKDKVNEIKTLLKVAGY